jgi:hypothetical protein
MYKMLGWENPRKGDHLEDLVVDGRIILKQSFKKLDRSLE